MFVLRVVQTLRGGNRVNRLLVVVHGDTVCEGAGQAVKPFFYCRSLRCNRDGVSELRAARIKNAGIRNIRDESME
jgi:hypothetical protein